MACIFIVIGRINGSCMNRKHKIIKKRKSINGAVTSFYDNEQTDKPCLLFLHPFPFNKDIWIDQLHFFCNDYHIIAPDFRGFGNSSPGYRQPSIELFTQDIKILMQHLGIEKANICGLSLGGYVALHIAKTDPGLIQSLMLCDTQCRNDTKLEMTARYKKVDDIIAYGLHYFSEVMLPKLLSVQSMQFNQGLIRKLKAMIYSGRKEAIVFTIMALARRSDTCSFLESIDKPSLILVGEQDKITPVKEAVFLHKHISNSMIKVIPQAGHLSNVDNPASFNEVIAAYLSMTGVKNSSKVA